MAKNLQCFAVPDKNLLHKGRVEFNKIYSNQRIILHKNFSNLEENYK